MNLLFMSTELFVSKLKTQNVSPESVRVILEKKVVLEECVEGTFQKYDTLVEKYSSSEAAKNLREKYQIKLLTEAEKNFEDFIKTCKENMGLETSGSSLRKGRKC